MRWRTPCGFTHTDADSKQRQLTKASREATPDRHGTPDRESQGNDRATIAPVRPACNGDSGNGVEERKREAHKQTHDRVRDPKLLFDGAYKYGEDLPINKVDDVDDEENGEYVVGIRRSNCDILGLVGLAGWAGWVLGHGSIPLQK